MNTLQEIEFDGFTGFKSINELTRDCTCLPSCGGVYLILKPDNLEVEFLSTGTGGYFKGKDPNVGLSVLQENWVNGSIVLYIGKATSLRKRLNQYFKFGQGKNIGHYGGRYIWQLKHASSLIVCWKPINGEEPRQAESRLIQKFVNKFGKRPFANLCD